MKQSKYDEAEKKFQTFNWTKVELKHVALCVVVVWVLSFNWTKVELKHGRWKELKSKVVTFNWTKVELKHS